MVPTNKKAETKGSRKRNARHRPGVLGALQHRGGERRKRKWVGPANLATQEC